GITNDTLERALKDVTMPDESVVEQDRKQPESTVTFERYMKRVVNQGRIRKAQGLAAEHRSLLKEVSEAYGIPSSVIVALWGIESNFGEITGNYAIIDSLATLAYEGRRAKFFEEELTNALRMIQNDHISPEEMTGSWAGAMGQCQFMPSSYLKFAQDFNRDGKKDIWDSTPDVFASIANYLEKSGWDGSKPWGVKATLPEGFDTGKTGRTNKQSLDAWKSQGVKFRAGLPSGQYAIVLPDDGDADTAYLVSTNYDVIMKWNRSLFFATAVGTLSDAITRGE
ncbi:MAG: lytic murein transglycosylase, partial [Alphaproteobacteria bacterium]|nr:lytic murein transglycosylase [Alphaproteobacteria bacterium]